MTSKQTTTLTCDACGAQAHDVTGEDSSWSPVRWAQVEWAEPPSGDGEKYRQWKKLDLCPDHLNEFLKWVAEEQAKRASRPHG